ncbi:unnamed protein product [Prorocentrum cordatum]|uniref:PH domain-containing protein n=1 Tax=Prorocentrum cordatum TaxID=2364126 RepID=A0ABN9V6S9_9DINO|nr:unnamed protein product [Polarella glacialis]
MHGKWTPERRREDDWDAFQSAPTSAAPAAPAPATAPAASGGLLGVAEAGAAGAAGAAAAGGGTEAGLLDPAAAPGEALEAPDPYSGLADALDKKGAGADSLISFGANDEFDPVAQAWAKEQPAAPKQAQPEAAASRAAVGDDFDPDPLAPERPKAAAAPASGSGPCGDLLDIGGGATGSNAPAEEDDFILDATHGIDLEPEKKQIFVYFKGEKNVVGWYSDMKAGDIKEAVLCACDAIIDGGFVLREVVFTGDDESTAEPAENGKTFDYEDFGDLQNGQTYIIEAAQERDDLKKFTGDRWRRLKVQVEPLLHVEAVKAIDRMKRGSNLLKHTHYGFPHLRQFQLSDDRKRLIWYSRGAKRKEDSVIQLEDVIEIRLGQTTPVFLHYRLPMLEHLSFSLVYGANGSKTLDLTCKDEFEFDHWVTGLKAIFYHFKNKQISKEQLLGHSKRFKKALEKSNVGIKLTKLPEVKEKGHVGLDDCIEIVAHTPQQLDTKMERLRERLKTMSQQVARLDVHAQAEMEVDLSLLMGQGPAYSSVFVQDEDAQDEDMEIRRMHELVEQTTQVLQQARNELLALNSRRNEGPAAASSSDQGAAAKQKKKEAAACKHIDQLLWKAEVDLENVEDMYLRHIDNEKEIVTPFSISMADVNRRLSEVSSEVEETMRTKLQELNRWFT